MTPSREQRRVRPQQTVSVGVCFSQREWQENFLQLQKVESLGSFIYIFTVLRGIPSKDGYVIFIGVVYMMACKCMINGNVAPNTYLSRPDLLALPLVNGLRGPCCY